MRYQQSLTIAANTAETDAVSARMRLTVGKISAATIAFPAGCQGLVGVRVLRGGHQLWPTAIAEWFVSDDFIIHIEEGYYLTDEPLELVLQAYNVDEEYSHTITLSIDLIEPAADPIAMLDNIAKRIAGTKPAATAGIPIEVQQAVLDIRDLLYMIHTSDLPMLFQAIATLRR